ncbi:MAG: MFS transporter [Chromatiales bacterium]|nr:MFS transporter [Chromatiales bacterium]
MRREHAAPSPVPDTGRGGTRALTVSACQYRWSMRYTFRSLTHRNFRLFYMGQLVSLSGTWMQSLAQAWLLYRLTGSGFMLGLAGAALLAPSLVFGLYGGVLADRFSRRKLMIAAQVLAMLQALVLAVLTLGGWVQPWHILTLAVLLGVVQAIELPARHSLISQLVPRADLTNAIALNASLFHASRLVGPAIAGVLVVLIGEGWVFAINALTFVAVLASLLAIRLPAPPAEPGPTPRGLRAGLSCVRSHAPIRGALAMVAAMALLGASVAVLLPVFAVEAFGVGAGRLGVMMGAIGAGALGGALLLAGRRDIVGLERVIAAAGVATGVMIMLFAATPVFVIALGLLAAIGFCMTTTLASSNAFIQTAVPDALRGRVMSLFSIALHGMMPLGNLAMGALSDAIGAGRAAGASGLLLVLAALYLGRPLRPAGARNDRRTGCGRTVAARRRVFRARPVRDRAAAV